jgi:hypothetical protein
MQITITKEQLVENLKTYFNQDLVTSLSGVNLDEDELQANIVLSRKRIEADAARISDLVFLSSTEQVTE